VRIGPEHIQPKRKRRYQMLSKIVGKEEPDAVRCHSMIDIEMRRGRRHGHRREDCGGLAGYWLYGDLGSLKKPARHLE
jgi:hypothetical protein